jgi:hypothetical protein
MEADEGRWAIDSSPDDAASIFAANACRV